MERGNSVTRRLIRRNCPSRSGCRRPSMVLRSVRLETVAEFVQKTVHRALADPVTLRPQACRKRGRAVAGPAQRILRTTAGYRFKPVLEGRQQLRCNLGQSLAAATRLACPRARDRPVGGRHVTGCDILRNLGEPSHATTPSPRPCAKSRSSRRHWLQHRPSVDAPVRSEPDASSRTCLSAFRPHNPW